MINRMNNSPTAMLDRRVCKARAAFNCIKCHSRLLGLFNRRVRVQLVSALAVTTLLYGSVIFGCLGPARLALKGGASWFAQKRYCAKCYAGLYAQQLLIHVLVFCTQLLIAVIYKCYVKKVVFVFLIVYKNTPALQLTL